MASHRHDPLVKAAGYAGKLGEPLYALSAGLLVVGLAARDRRLARSRISVMAALGVATGSGGIVRRRVHHGVRPRKPLQASAKDGSRWTACS